MEKFEVRITRQFLPIGSVDGQWEQHPFERVVWVYANGQVKAMPQNDRAPTGYIPGMLRTYIDGCRVDPHELDVALEATGYTRADIERQIADART